MFTAPRAGVYLTTFSYQGSTDPGQWTNVILYKNGNRMHQTNHHYYYSPNGRGWVASTGGQAVYQRLEAGDTLNLQTDGVSGIMYRIIFCVQFINI